MKDNGKLLLEQLSEQPLDAYRLYLKKTALSGSNHTELSRLPDHLLLKFYGEDPAQPPAFFDLRESSDVSVLESALNTNLVINYWCASGRCYRVHDTRVLQQVRVGGGMERAGTRHFRLGAEKVLEECASEDRLADPDAGFRRVRMKMEGCLPALFDFLLRTGENSPMPTARLPCPHPPGTTWCHDLKEVLKNRDGVLATVSRSFLLATHIRSRPWGRPLEARAQHFANVNFYFPSDEMPEAGCPVLCLERRGFVYSLKETFVPALLEKLRDPTRSASAPPAMLKRPAPPSLPTAERRSTCDCDACAEAHEFAPNMKEGGPPLLYSTQLPLVDLLKLVGQDNPRNRHVLSECSLYSFAAYDVESSGCRIDGKAGNETRHLSGESVSGAHAGREVKNVQQAELIGLADRLQLRQEGEPRVFRAFNYPEESGPPPDMIGSFLDAIELMRHNSVIRKYELLTELQDWAEGYRTAHNDFFIASGYVDRQTDRECALQYKRCQEGDVKQPDPGKVRAGVLRKVDTAFTHTYPFGQIWKRLRDLAERYFVLGYNSEHFDLPLLSAALSTRFKSRCSHAQIRMNRQGSAVRSLSCNKINFVEVKRLLPPGTSLDGFGKMMGLEITKDLFPFELFSSSAFLCQPELPADAALWYSPLSGRGPSQEEVDGVRADYALRGHRRVGDHLSSYLRKDVLILLEGTARLLAGFVNLLDVDFVEANKLTVSGLANLGGQLNLFRQMSPGFTSPNDTLVYSLLRKGLRGGLSSVQRSFAGADVDPEPYARLAREADPALSEAESLRLANGINAHLYPDEQTPAANVVHSLDIHSLYPAAGTATAALSPPRLSLSPSALLLALLNSNPCQALLRLLATICLSLTSCPRVCWKCVLACLCLLVAPLLFLIINLPRI